MSTATTARAAGTVPASRESADEAPDRAPRGKPCDWTDGLPVYRWGQAPAYLRTQTQLGEERLKLADGQAVVAYIRTRKYGDFPLYDPAAAVKMRPLASAVKRRMEAARTCSECGKVRQHALHGRPCSQCWEKAQRARQRERARTCWGCGTVRERPYPVAHHRCQDCRRAQLAEERAEKAEWLQRAVTCPGRDCSVQTASKAEVRRWAAADAIYQPWSRRWCPPCEEREARERAEAQERAAAAREAEREARRRRVLDLREWAAAALADEDLVVLDTETTGLDAEACVVELTVISGSGDVLVDTLVNPGRPIPAGASEIHGITDEAVAGAPSFGQVLVGLTAALDGRRCLIWNAPYDEGVLRWELTRHYRAAGHEDPAASAAAWLDGMTLEDAMVPYSDWYGDWNDYFGNYQWQPLGGGHRALGDVRAVLDRLREMAAPVASSVD